MNLYARIGYLFWFCFTWLLLLLLLLFSVRTGRQFVSLGCQANSRNKASLINKKYSGKTQRVIINEKWKSFAANVLIVKLGQTIKNKLQSQ